MDFEVLWDVNGFKGLNDIFEVRYVGYDTFRYLEVKFIKI